MMINGSWAITEIKKANAEVNVDHLNSLLQMMQRKTK